jgi:hypothetical protein
MQVLLSASQMLLSAMQVLLSAKYKRHRVSGLCATSSFNGLFFV